MRCDRFQRELDTSHHNFVIGRSRDKTGQFFLSFLRGLSVSSQAVKKPSIKPIANNLRNNSVSCSDVLHALSLLSLNLRCVLQEPLIPMRNLVLLPHSRSVPGYNIESLLQGNCTACGYERLRDAVRKVMLAAAIGIQNKMGSELGCLCLPASMANMSDSRNELHQGEVALKGEV